MRMLLHYTTVNAEAGWMLGVWVGRDKAAVQKQVGFGVGVDGWMDGWMDGCMDGWMDAWMDGWVDECVEIFDTGGSLLVLK